MLQRLSWNDKVRMGGKRYWQIIREVENDSQKFGCIDPHDNNLNIWPFLVAWQSLSCTVLPRISCNGLSASVLQHQFFLCGKTVQSFKVLFNIISWKLLFQHFFFKLQSCFSSFLFKIVRYFSVWCPPWLDSWRTHPQMERKLDSDVTGNLLKRSFHCSIISAEHEGFWFDLWGKNIAKWAVSRSGAGTF